jgi:hypothetical protein
MGDISNALSIVRREKMVRDTFYLTEKTVVKIARHAKRLKIAKSKLVDLILIAAVKELESGANNGGQK